MRSRDDLVCNVNARLEICNYHLLLEIVTMNKLVIKTLLRSPVSFYPWSEIVMVIQIPQLNM